MKTSISVAEMLRTTGQNTAQFMIKIAEHVESLENEIRRLADRVAELEGKK